MITKATYALKDEPTYAKRDGITAQFRANFRTPEVPTELLDIWKDVQTSNQENIENGWYFKHQGVFFFESRTDSEFEYPNFVQCEDWCAEYHGNLYRLPSL